MSSVAAELVIVRCPSCGGLRGISRRRGPRDGDTCKDCQRGSVVRREDFYEFWLARFSVEEIREMAKALWPPSEG